MLFRISILLAAFLGLECRSWAASSTTRTVPFRGLPIEESTRANLERDVLSLGREIELVEYFLRERADLRALLPDVRIYHKAVRWALHYDEFVRSNDVTVARALLEEGARRCAQLREGRAPWTTATGLVVRGYISKLDGSVQPYGLVVPASFRENPARGRRLDVWLHGRDNQLTELKFIADRQRSAGEFAPADTIVLHPYGRYCNAFKFAGEVDVFEAIEAVQRDYVVDTNRIVVRGFSMGGAGCWHLAAHHAGFWAGAAPGAGFAETAQYTGAFERFPWPRGFEQILWHWYDATAYAGNLLQCPTIAYSGELDKQKQAADVMAEAMRAEGLELTHLIGPGVAHKYEPGAKQEVARLVDAAAAAGRKNEPEEVRLVTWTLRYNRMKWVTIDGLERHWRRTAVTARRTASRFDVRTENVSHLTLDLPSVTSDRRTFDVLIDGARVEAKLVAGASRIFLAKRAGRWQPTDPRDDVGLRKRPGLQGPIDDAFMDSFLFVRPTGQPLLEKQGAWVAAALTRATNEWRAQFRGEVRIKDDLQVTPEDITAHHLILWGDPQSNRFLSRVINRLPLRWTQRSVEIGPQGFPAGTVVPLMIYPNPLNPRRYIVLNSGFTFWKTGESSNALQTPKLPDFAVLDLTVPLQQIPNWGVVSAGFFDEAWEFPESAF